MVSRAGWELRVAGTYGIVDDLLPLGIVVDVACNAVQGGDLVREVREEGVVLSVIEG